MTCEEAVKHPFIAKHASRRPFSSSQNQQWHSTLDTSFCSGRQHLQNSSNAQVNNLVQITENNESVVKLSAERNNETQSIHLTTQSRQENAPDDPKIHDQFQVTSVKKHKRTGGCQLSFALATKAHNSGSQSEIGIVDQMSTQMVRSSLVNKSNDLSARGKRLRAPGTHMKVRDQSQNYYHKSNLLSLSHKGFGS